MNIGVFGTGIVGRTLASKLDEIGHSVVIGTRDPRVTLARTESDRMGNPPIAEWLKQNAKISLRSFTECAAHGEMLVNATNGSATIDVLTEAGEANLKGKILIDISNPLDASRGMPPSLFISNTDSLAELIQRTFPNTKVVKTLNTVTARLMVDPHLLGEGNHTIFVSGNDPDAKEKVTGLLRDFGWEDILDLGDITTARGVEMYLPLWLRLWGALGTGIFNIKVVR